MGTFLRFTILGLALCAMAAGCASGCNNPASPSNNNSGTPTATPTTLTYETYEGAPYTGNWVAPDPGAQLGFQYLGAGAGNYCVEFYSLSLNATTNDHFRNTFGSVTPSAALTVSFMFNASNLNAAPTQNLKIHLQMSDNLVKWSFEIVGIGTAYLFNNSYISPCQHCPAAGTGWHTMTVKSQGNVTSSLSFDGYPSETSFAPTYTSGITADILGLDILHITAGDCLNTAGSKFLMDEFKVTTP